MLSLLSNSLQFFLILHFPSNSISPKLKSNSPRHFMPSEQSKIHLIKKASHYCISPFFTVIFYMPFKFGRVHVMAPLMTFSKFKNQPSVLSPVLLTMLTPNLSSKSCKSYPSPTSFRSTNFNSCKDLTKISSLHPLTTPG